MTIYHLSLLLKPQASGSRLGCCMWQHRCIQGLAFDSSPFSRYCRENYDPEQEHRKDVYLCLINMYLSPPDLKGFGIEIPEDTAQPEANVKDALSVLTRHHHLIDTTKVRLFCASPVLISVLFLSLHPPSF